MEAIAVIAVVAALVVVLGIKTEYIIYALSLLVLTVLAFMEIFFDIAFVFLLRSRKTQGRLLRVEKNKEYRFKTNIYEVEGREIPCRFPTDGLYGRRNTGKTVRLRINRKGTAVFDSVSAVTCVAGFILSNAAAVFVIYLLVNVFNK